MGPKKQIKQVRRPKGTVILNVNVPVELKRRAKAALALKGKTITQVIIETLKREAEQTEQQ